MSKGAWVFALYAPTCIGFAVYQGVQQGFWAALIILAMAIAVPLACSPVRFYRIIRGSATSAKAAPEATEKHDGLPDFGYGWFGLLNAMRHKDYSLFCEIQSMRAYDGIVAWRDKHPPFQGSAHNRAFFYPER
jgi:hypothetical protein